MADVRSLLKTERAARRIQHKHASYSTTGTLLCTVCHLQLKSDTLWDGHLRSAGHLMRVQKLLDAAPIADTPVEDVNKRKRKASDEEEGGGVDTIRKRTKASDPSLPAGFFDAGKEQDEEDGVVVKERITPTNEIQMNIPSRPATPLKTTHEIPIRPDVNVNVDEDEWAAFEADIAAAEVLPPPESATVLGNGEGVISAPAMTAVELKQKEVEEDNKRRTERLEAEAEGDKEDAARKLEEEFDQMVGLEQRVRRLREKREALRMKEGVIGAPEIPIGNVEDVEGEDEEDDDEDDDDDDWDRFRMM